METIVKNIPLLSVYPLQYVFEHIGLKHEAGTLWLELGVFTGNTINYISKFTPHTVFGFDSFEGLPEDWRPEFSMGGQLPRVNQNVRLIKGWFDKTLSPFIRTENMDVSFIHIDCDLYSSTKYTLDTLCPYIKDGCIIVFDELLEYDGFMGNTGELKALWEFINTYEVIYKWIGYKGEKAVLQIISINKRPERRRPLSRRGQGRLRIKIKKSS